MSAPGTPGPWPCEHTGDAKRYLIGKGLVDGPRGYDVAEVYSDDCDPSEAAANAHLIAAAPDLYEAVQCLLAEARERGGGLSNGEKLGCAALAKAKGETL